VLTTHKDAIIQAHFSPDSQHLVTVSNENVWLWSMQTGKSITTFEGQNMQVRYTNT
jgi:WD40 repeat protein